MTYSGNKEIIFTGKDKEVQDDWNIYWSNQNKTTGRIYDKFADFYRNNIIRPALNFFIFKYFKTNTEILHAGCGSGKVDTDIVDLYKVTALDISLPALHIYESVNPKKAKLIQASIFELPFENESFDGIYNLGVMEHFTENEIQNILLEFKRILKPGGKIVLFIPPVFGLTVRVLDTAHFI
ncbi:MAG: class I SAM-dependent methyltransferase, partial [Opitutaceae bacterium]|nr:class I SAM-dependent methyltransferase [Cytophagales bacterium]